MRGSGLDNWVVNPYGGPDRWIRLALGRPSGGPIHARITGVSDDQITPSDSGSVDMIGIDVGATDVTHSDGSTFLHRVPDTPADLLARVAGDLPDVRVDENGCSLRPAREIYATIVARSIPPRHRGSTVALATPAWWSPRVMDQVLSALLAQSLEAVLVNEAEAAVAEHQAAGHRMPETVAVVSVRAASSSVAIVEHCQERPAARVAPAFVLDEGGDRLDVAVLHHLVDGLTDLGDMIDGEDVATIAAAREALRHCRELREALSVSTVESLHPELPGADHHLRLVRSELEELAAPWMASVTRMVASALDQYGRPVDALLLVGGLAAMPMVSQYLSAELAVEVLVAQEPRLVVARGARRLLPEEVPAGRGRRVGSWFRGSSRRSKTTRVDGRRRREETPQIDAPPGRVALALPPGSLDDAAPERLVEEFTPVSGPAPARGHRQLTS